MDWRSLPPLAALRAFAAFAETGSVVAAGDALTDRFNHEPIGADRKGAVRVPEAKKRTFEFAHAHGLPVIVHSCGFIEPLVPGLLDAGMDCLQVMEVKAGMDCRRLKREYGDRLAFMGGMFSRYQPWERATSSIRSSP